MGVMISDGLKLGDRDLICPPLPRTKLRSCWLQGTTVWPHPRFQPVPASFTWKVCRGVERGRREGGAGARARRAGSGGGLAKEVGRFATVFQRSLKPVVLFCEEVLERSANDSLQRMGRLWRATRVHTHGARRFSTPRAAARTLSGAAAVELVDGVHPVIDVSNIVNSRGGHGAGDGAGAARTATLAAMAAALKDRGYFYARGVEALPEDYIDGIYAYSER